MFLLLYTCSALHFGSTNDTTEFFRCLSFVRAFQEDVRVFVWLSVASLQEVIAVAGESVTLRPSLIM